MNGMDHISGNFVIVGKFKDRLDSERWGSWFRKVLKTSSISNEGLTYLFSRVTVVTRPDITTPTVLWRTTLNIKYERTNGGMK